MKQVRGRPPAWQKSGPARSIHAAVAVLAAAGLATSLYIGWSYDTQLPAEARYSGGFSAGWRHTLNQPAYFTFLSATLVFLTSTLLALKPGRQSLVFHTLRLCGVVSVVITGAVFNLLLRADVPMSGVWLFNDVVLHQALPIVAPLVWLVIGPHGQLSGRAVVLSCVVPLAWLAITLLRGPWLDWYPYIILDVPRLGYTGVSVYLAAILLVYFTLALLCWGIDRLIAAQSAARE